MTNHRRDLLYDAGSQFEIPADSEDPDRHTAASEEATQTLGQPVEYYLEVHDLVELTHEFDQGASLAVLALPVGVLDPELG